MATSRGQDCIGRFEVMAELGRGSMGIVYRAHDPVMGRDVAIKTVLLPYGLPTEQKAEFHERFRREARAAGRLSHPGIVTVYDFNEGATAGTPFITMEYVEGRTLHDLIHTKDALDRGWVLSLGENLADALQMAHEAGIVHRDLKPANILVRETDRVGKISDFGVARVNCSELTMAGSTYGSPAYMAPERLHGAPADARSDLFALAVILYEALCGYRPFGGDDFASTCAAILHEAPVPLGPRAPDLAPAFDRFFTRALAKNPDERFQSGAAFRDGLRALRDEQAWFRSGEATAVIAGPAAPAARVAADAPPGRARIARLAPFAILLILVLALLAFGRATRDPSDDGTPGVVPAAAASETAAPPSQPERARPAAAEQTVPKAKSTEKAPAAVPAASASAVKPARLDLRVTSRVKAGALALFIDGQQVYATALAAASLPSDPKQVFARQEHEVISARVDVPAGRHSVLAKVSAGARKLEQGLEINVEAGDTRRLSIAVGRRILGRDLTLTLE